MTDSKQIEDHLSYSKRENRLVIVQAAIGINQQWSEIHIENCGCCYPGFTDASSILRRPLDMIVKLW